ncbi:unnamed protein product [Microthlaspi erraticum]|uniref:Uncharacterized protein n=1 Tax=Microthlaspi erraticum TaxID=1685480 RepID=A0A6D2I4E9_9BRAS|nr:unnamed protein product [Microthlaspi erraticum]
MVVLVDFCDNLIETRKSFVTKKKEPEISFSREEGFGKYLDLHAMYKYNQYINSKFGGGDAKIEYSAYLDVFSRPPCNKQKCSKQNRKYMEDLLGYLVGFFKRTKPSQDLDTILSNVEIGFEEQETATTEELMDLGAEKLKEALAALGLKVGGTVQQRAERLKKHQKSAREIAIIEAKVKKLCALLDETIQRTKQNVNKKTYSGLQRLGLILLITFSIALLLVSIVIVKKPSSCNLNK